MSFGLYSYIVVLYSAATGGDATKTCSGVSGLHVQSVAKLGNKLSKRGVSSA